MKDQLKLKVEITPKQSVGIKSALHQLQLHAEAKLHKLKLMGFNKDDVLVKSYQRQLEEAIEARESFNSAVESYFNS